MIEYVIYDEKPKIIAFKIQEVPYFLKINDGIYTINGNKEWAINIDDWFQSKTNQQYSYSDIIKMAEAWVSCHKQYNDTNVITKTVELLTNEFINEFKNLYSIELGITKISDIITDIRDYHHRYNKQEAANMLGRCMKACSGNLEITTIIDKIIQRFNLHPNTKIDNSVLILKISKAITHDNYIAKAAKSLSR